MKLALILNVIDPKIGGVMIMGDRGTGKSTTIRALADLLPEIKVRAAARGPGRRGEGERGGCVGVRLTGLPTLCAVEHPPIQVVDKDPFNSDPEDPELMSEEIRQRAKAGEPLPVGTMKIPMVDLPLGATEDRVCGTIDIEKALTEGACC